jgi:hypothetical protein
VYYKVVNGMSMKIVPSGQVDWPPPFKDATEKYSAQVRLSRDNRSLVGYVAGQPFPLIDTNDPQVATKIMWNNVFRPLLTDDYDLRFYDCESVYGGQNKPNNVIQYYQIGHYAGYDFVGRVEVEPMPVDPDFKKTNRLWLFGLYPVLAPQAERGTGFIRFRYEQPAATTTGAGIPERGEFAASTRRCRVRRPARKPGIRITTQASTLRLRNTITNFSATARCSESHTQNIHRS